MSDSAIPWTAAYQAPPSMGFSRQEYWSGVPLPSPLMWLPGNYSSLPERAWWEGRQIHLVSWLQGTWIRQKPVGNRWGCCCDFLPVDRPYSAESRPGPHLPALCLVCFLNSGTKKNQACQNQGSVFNIIMTAVKRVNTTQNQREKRRTSLGQVWGEETNPTSFYHPRGLQEPTRFHLRGPSSRDLGPNQGSCDPRSGDCVGLTPSTWVRIL